MLRNLNVAPESEAASFGMVVIEAFATGLPVVASRVGAATELITPGVNGWLHEPVSRDTQICAVGGHPVLRTRPSA